MKIQNRTEFVSGGKDWSLNGQLSVRNINSLLGGKVKDIGVSADGKSTHEWMFYADGKPCQIWDYKGVRWSASGPREVFEELGMRPEVG